MQKYDLVCQKGATFRKVLRLKQGGVPIDLTGWSARSQVREPSRCRDESLRPATSKTCSSPSPLTTMLLPFWYAKVALPLPGLSLTRNLLGMALLPECVNV